jgi:hypothetical protein
VYIFATAVAQFHYLVIPKRKNEVLEKLCYQFVSKNENRHFDIVVTVAIWYTLVAGVGFEPTAFGTEVPTEVPVIESKLSHLAISDLLLPGHRQALKLCASEQSWTIPILAPSPGHRDAIAPRHTGCIPQQEHSPE